MKKILVAFNANGINMNVLDFASFLAKLSGSKLTGIFLENVYGDERPVLKNLYGTPYVETILAEDIPGNKIRINQCEENVRIFEKACSNRSINYSIHLDKGMPVEEIISESRFADLLVVDAEMSFKEKQEGVLTGFIKEVLSKSECPVVIAPFSFYNINEIVFAYDGSSSSVFAIKQFAYLFPEFGDHKITILQVNEKNEDLPIIEKQKISELLQINFSNIGFQTLQGKASDELFGYLLGRKNIFLVMGAFGNNMFSSFFKHSTAELVIKTINLPVFIAHH